jgi:hypothetical protein
VNGRIKKAGVAVTAAAALAGAAVAASADSGDAIGLTPVATANTKSPGYAPASKLSTELRSFVQAQGSTKLENPQGIVSFYGYENDVPSAGDPSVPQMVATPTTPTEAQKTEPDKNTYLVFKRGQSGPDSSYRYGTHFVYQGHESAATVNGKKQGYLTRVNLDADPEHRVTLLATTDNKGEPIATIDGSTWDPFAQRLIFTTESTNAPTYAATADYPSTVEDVSGALGRGGYEGVQNDSAGNLWIVEDIGGPNKQGTTARQPNSFVYRYVPAKPGDLHNGKLQALQVLNEAGQPITFESQAALQAPDEVALHVYGKSFQTRWVTVHDTAVAGTAPFNANTAAKAAHATPFKRPENGVFRPGSDFREFYFDETGDTNATSPENDTAGGWTAALKLVQSDPTADTGKLMLFYKGDAAHAGFDNVQFLSRNQITFVEDAGDTLHQQRNALDSGYVFDVTRDYGNSANQPVRWLAEGRDPSATIDSAMSGFGKNDGDNEITGAHVSDGDPSVRGILGAKEPHLFQDGWRWFYSEQHGNNPLYEVIPAGSSTTGENGSGQNG